MSRFIDERGRIFGKVNVVDIVVLLVVVAIIVFAVMRLTDSSVETRPVTIVYTVEAVRDPTAKAIMAQLEKKVVVRNDAGTVLGRLEAAEVTSTPEEHLTSADRLESFPSPIFRDIRLTVAGRGQVAGDGTVRIGSLPLLIGKKMTIRAGTAEVQSTITGVSY